MQLQPLATACGVESCQFCIHWLENDRQPNDITSPRGGMCRRYPPSMGVVLMPAPNQGRIQGGGIQVMPQQVAMRPMTLAEDYCGEFSPKINGGRG